MTGIVIVKPTNQQPKKNPKNHEKMFTVRLMATSGATVRLIWKSTGAAPSSALLSMPLRSKMT